MCLHGEGPWVAPAAAQRRFAAAARGKCLETRGLRVARRVVRARFVAEGVRARSSATRTVHMYAAARRTWRTGTATAHCCCVAYTHLCWSLSSASSIGATLRAAMLTCFFAILRKSAVCADHSQLLSDFSGLLHSNIRICRERYALVLDLCHAKCPIQRARDHYPCGRSRALDLGASRLGVSIPWDHDIGLQMRTVTAA